MKTKRLRKMAGISTKRGSSLVEVVVAITVLAVVVVTVVSGLCMAQQSVLDYNGQENYNAQAQSSMDALITLFANESGTVDNVLMEKRSEATCVNQSAPAGGVVANWNPTATKNKQFFYQEVTDPTIGKGFNITVRVYFDSGKRHVEMTTFVANSGGVF